MARTSLEIADAVMRELERLAERERRPLEVLVSELLAEALAHRREEAQAAPLEFIVRDLRPLADMDDKDALWAVLDGRVSDRKSR